MLVLSLLGGMLLSPGSEIGVTVDNIEAGDTVSYPLVILRGHTDEQGVRAGLDGAKLLYFPAFQGRYIALCELRPGGNFVSVKAGPDKLRMRVDYAPSKSPYRVRAAWLTGKPVAPATFQNIRSKIDLNLKLLQSFTAEKMWEAGCGRKTFQLSTADDRRIDLANPTPAVARDEDIAALARKGIGAHLANPQSRTIVFAGDANRVVGDPPFLIANAAPVAYWPSALGDVARTFANRKRIDSPLCEMDALSRGTIWAGYSSTLGGILNRLGSTFGLNPTNDAQSVMGSGYALLNRAFLAYEAPCVNQSEETPVFASNGPKWDPDDARRLSASPFFNP